MSQGGEGVAETPIVSKGLTCVCYFYMEHPHGDYFRTDLILDIIL